MADIPGNLDKMNDIEIAFDASVSEQLFNKIGANINALIDVSGNFNLFTSNGTLDIPENLSYVFTLGCGGGGGGGGGFDGLGTLPIWGAQGGFSSLLYLNVFAVTALETLTVTVGGGGAGGTYVAGGGTNGSDGGNTTISGLSGTLTYFGASGGQGGGNTTGSTEATELALRNSIDANELYGQFTYNNGSNRTFARRSANYYTTPTALSTQPGGSGAPSDFGVGGAGAAAVFLSGSAAPATSYGAGGGGGGQSGGNGAAGAGGAAIIFW